MNGSKYRVVGALCLFSCATFCAVRTRGSEATIATRVVAFLDQAAPGTLGDARFISFDPPVINNAGETAFRAVAGPSGSFYGTTGLWFEGAGILNLVALDGGQPQIDFDTLQFIYTDQEKVVFPTTTGISVATTFGISPIVKTGDLVPGGNGLPFASIGKPTVSDNGTIAFYGLGQRGIFTANNGTLSLVAKPGQYPGPDVPWSYAGGGTPVVNASGQVAIGTGQGIWTNIRGQFEAIAHASMQAPGLDSGVTFGAFILERVTLSGQNDLVFPAVLTDPILKSSRESVWRFRDGISTPILILNDQAPGLPSGVVFSGFSDPLTNQRTTDVLLHARLSGPGVDDTNKDSLWRWRNGSLHLIARTGMHAPGYPEGVTIASIDSPVMNGNGQTAFKASLLGIEPTSYAYNPQEVAIFAEATSDNLRPIVRKEDLTDVDPGPGVDLRHFDTLFFGTEFPRGSLNFNHGSNDQPYAFNDRGQVAFEAVFLGGGRGIFVTPPLTSVPEPNGLWIASIGFFVIMIFHRSRRPTMVVYQLYFFCRSSVKLPLSRNRACRAIAVTQMN